MRVASFIPRVLAANVFLLAAGCGRFGFESSVSVLPDGGVSGSLEAGNEAGDGADAQTSAPGSSVPTCGNHRVEASETCDDGNLVAGDGCDADCVPSFTVSDGTEVIADGSQIILPSLRSDEFLLLVERTNYVLPRDVVTDVSLPGAFDGVTQQAGIIAARTRVHVYLLHFFPGIDARVSSTVDVNTRGAILGLMLSNPGLAATDDLGLQGADYPITSRGIGPIDTGELTPYRLSLQCTVNPGYTDEVRLFVAADDP